MAGFDVYSIVALTYYLTAWFRLFVGDLSNDVSDDVLANAFNKYTSFQRARVIRDRLSQKVCPITCDSHRSLTIFAN